MSSRRGPRNLAHCRIRRYFETSEGSKETANESHPVVGCTAVRAIRLFTCSRPAAWCARARLRLPSTPRSTTAPLTRRCRRRRRWPSIARRRPDTATTGSTATGTGPATTGRGTPASGRRRGRATCTSRPGTSSTADGTSSIAATGTTTTAAATTTTTRTCAARRPRVAGEAHRHRAVAACARRRPRRRRRPGEAHRRRPPLPLRVDRAGVAAQHRRRRPRLRRRARRLEPAGEERRPRAVRDRPERPRHRAPGWHGGSQGPVGGAPAPGRPERPGAPRLAWRLAGTGRKRAGQHAAHVVAGRPARLAR